MSWNNDLKSEIYTQVDGLTSVTGLDVPQE